MTRRSAFIRLFCVALIWGCNNVIMSYLLHGFSPIFLSFVRILMTTLLLVFMGLRDTASLHRPSKRQWFQLVAAGFFGTFLNQIFAFTGLKYTTAAETALINALGPIATLILARYFLNERFTVFKSLGALLSFLGVIVIIWFKDGSSGLSIGDIFIFGAMLSFAISTIYVRKLMVSLTPYDVTLFSTMIACLFLGSSAGVEWAGGGLKLSLSPYMWMLIAFIGIIGQCLTGLWWNSGIEVVGAGTTAMFINIPPFVTLIVAHYALGDAIYPAQVIGGIFVLSGVLLANKQASPPVIKNNEEKAKISS
jgi:drug/metabolite transporter (DMT)-like permease